MQDYTFGTFSNALETYLEAREVIDLALKKNDLKMQREALEIMKAAAHHMNKLTNSLGE